MDILAVDDEKIALEGLVRSLQEAEPGCETHAFRKAGEALEFFRNHPCDVVFLDIQMRTVNGIALAQELQEINPQVNIIFATGYAEYMGDAFALHASGYLIKPITPQKVRTELNNLRQPVSVVKKKQVYIHTFGNFEIYVDSKPVKFRYDKTKELLAYLVDRNGSFCSNAELMSVLWNGENRSSYLGNLKKDLLDTLHEYGCEKIVEAGRNRLRIVPEAADCDYFDWYKGKLQPENNYHGEYMSQYSWAELTNGDMYKKYVKK